MSLKKETQGSAKSTTAINKKSKGLTDDERAAMKARAQVVENVVGLTICYGFFTAACG